MKTVWLFFVLTLCFAASLKAEELFVADSEKATPAEAIAPAESEEDAVSDAELERDPFTSGMDTSVPMPGEVASNVGPEPVLQGIAQSGGKAAIVINGKTYVKGDDAQNGIQLVEVREGEADIRWGGQLKTLNLGPKRKERKQSISTVQTSPTTPEIGPAALSGATIMTDLGQSPAPMEDSK